MNKSKGRGQFSEPQADSKENMRRVCGYRNEWRYINETKCSQLPAMVEGNGGLWIIE